MSDDSERKQTTSSKVVRRPTNIAIRVHYYINGWCSKGESFKMSPINNSR